MPRYNPHPALIYDERDHQDYPSWVEIAPGVTYAVTDSPDWRLRSQYDIHRVQDFDGFVRALESRGRYFLDRFPVPSNLDVRFARCYDERAYASGLAGLGQDCFSNVTRLIPEMLLFSPQQVGVAADGSIEWTTNLDEREYSSFRPDDHLRDHERRHRHRTSAFVSYQDRDVAVLHSRAVGERYVRLPQWWVEYEVPYRFRAQTPPVLTYRGLRFMSPHCRGWDLILRAEWATMCLIELLNEAYNGWLWWLPSHVLDDINQLGVSNILREASSSVIESAEALLNEVRVIRWDRVTSENRLLPRMSYRFTPVYQSGEFVEFDVDNWCTQLAGDMYLPRDSNGRVIGITQRGSRLYGSTVNQPAFVTPGGRQPGLDENDREPGYRVSERFGESQRKWSIARGVVRSVAEQLGIINLLQDLGHTGPWDIKFLMVHYRGLLLEKTALMRSRGPGMITAGPSESVQVAPVQEEELASSDVAMHNTSNVQVTEPITPGTVVQQAGASVPPRMETLPGSVADHAALSNNNQSFVGVPQQQTQPSSQNNAQQQLGEEVIPVDVPLSSNDTAMVEGVMADRILDHNLALQSYVELLQEGEIRPEHLDANHPDHHAVGERVMLRVVTNGAAGAPNPRNVDQRPITGIDTNLVYERPGTPTMVDQAGILRSVTRDDDPSSLQAGASVEEARDMVRANNNRSS